MDLDLIIINQFSKFCAHFEFLKDFNGFGKGDRQKVEVAFIFKKQQAKIVIFLARSFPSKLEIIGAFRKKNQR